MATESHALSSGRNAVDTVRIEEDVEASIPPPPPQSARSSYLGQVSGCVGVLRIMTAIILTLTMGCMILYKLTCTENVLDKAVVNVSKLADLVEPVVSPLRAAVDQYATRNATAH